MPVPSTTRNAFAALLCAALAAGCSQSASGHSFDPGSGGDDSSVVPPAAGDSGASSEDASAVDGTGAGGDDTDANAPAKGNPQGAPDSGRASGMSTPDAGTGGSIPGSDGGPCTVNLSCVLAAPASTGDIVQDCVNRINQFRTTCACLKPLARWTDGEACANMDSQYDAMQMMGHAGAMANICNWGDAQDECPGDPSNQYRRQHVSPADVERRAAARRDDHRAVRKPPDDRHVLRNARALHQHVEPRREQGRVRLLHDLDRRRVGRPELLALSGQARPDHFAVQPAYAPPASGGGPPGPGPPTALTAQSCRVNDPQV